MASKPKILIRDVVGEQVLSCPTCQSVDIMKAGTAPRRNGYKQSYQCGHCRRRFVHGKLIKVTEYG